MKNPNKNLPALIGFIVLVVGVGIAGSPFVNDNAPDDWTWSKQMIGPFRWKFLPDGVDVDRWVGQNLIPLVFVAAAGALLLVVSRRVANGGGVAVFFSVWGAVVGGGIIAGITATLYNKLVLDYPTFTPYGSGGILDELHFGVDTLLDGAVFAGFCVALTVAIVTAVTGPSHLAPTYTPTPHAGGPLDPSPPMTSLPPMTSTPTPPPPPTAVQSPVDPASPPADPPADPTVGPGSP